MAGEPGPELLGGVAVDLRQRRRREPHPALDGCIKGTTGLAWWQMVCTRPGWCSWQGGCLRQGATQATGVTLLPVLCQCQVYVHSVLLFRALYDTTCVHAFVCGCNMKTYTLSCQGILMIMIPA